MRIEEFWEVIETAKEQARGDMDRKCEIVRAAVQSMPPETANAFSRHFDETMDRAYTWSLWGSAYVINGGCSDDTFPDFRASLISRNRENFEQAVGMPDFLAHEEFDEEAWFYEGFQYAVHEGAEAAIAPNKLPITAGPDEPSGAPWEEDPEVLKNSYPQLWAKFKHVWSVPDKASPSKSKPWWKF